MRINEIEGNDNELADVVKKVADFVRPKLAKHSQLSSFHTEEFSPTQHGIAFRHWGVWVMPDGEEDDGDYDWEELSFESSRILDGIVNEAKALVPADFGIEWTAEEKNWIHIQVWKKP